MGEIKFPTKKQTIYLVCGKRSDLRVEMAEGYVIDLTNNKGFTTQIALLCKGKSWYATHFETGLDCTPKTKTSGELKLHWSRDNLIKRLQEIDFERCLIDRKGNKVFQYCIDLIEEYKRGNK